MAISGGTVVSDSYLNLQNSTSVITPILQAEDGSYFGTETWNVVNSYYSSMQAFDLSGNVKWSVPGFTPVMATADGGVIAKSTTGEYETFDQNGVANGMLANLPQLSWKGAYQLGSVESVVPAVIDTAWSWLAFLGGNPTGNGTDFRLWYFKLNWQNDFYLIPDDPSELTNLKVDLTSNTINIVKSEALKAFKHAYFGFPVFVSEGAAGTGDDWAIVLDNFDDVNCPSGLAYGCTDQDVLITLPDQNPRVRKSEVNYTDVMEEGQWALGIVINNAQDESRVLQQRQDLFAAIGRGIGVTAAHEIAHHFLAKCCSMDASPNTDPAAWATYNEGSTSVVTDPSMFTGYWPGPPPIYLHWEPATLTGLNKCLNSGWQNYKAGGPICFQ